MLNVSAEQLAHMFHETYERLAPQYGYQTRSATAVPWEQLPSTNKELMIAVCTVILATLNAGSTPDSQLHSPQ